MVESLFTEFADKLVAKLLKKYKNKVSNIDNEADLVAELRSYSMGGFFVPFAEYFVNASLAKGIAVRSYYLISKLFKYIGLLNNSDKIGEVGASYLHKDTEKLIMDDENDYYIIKGTIINLLDALGLKKSLDLIKKRILTKFPTGIDDIDIYYVFNYVNVPKLLKIIREEINEEPGKPLLQAVAKD